MPWSPPMHRPVQLEVMRRLIAAIDASQDAAVTGQSLLDTERYTEERELDAEKAALFRRRPVAVAHASELADAGSFVSEQIANVPVMAVRDGEGTIRVFVNACRHRGARLVDAPCGKKKAFTCPYHAWSYDLKGTLIHVPHPEVFGSGFDPADRPLREVPSEVRHGFVWARLEGNETLDIAGFLGQTLDDDFAGFGLADAHALKTVTHTKRANWKLVMDAFAEGYHLKALHRESLARFFLETALVDDCAPHVRQIGARKAIHEAAKMPEDTWDLRELTTVFYNVFPNVVFVVHPTWITQMSLFPEAVDTVRVVHRMLVPRPPESDEEHAKLEKSFNLIDGQVFQKEDLAIAESIQSTMGSGTPDKLVLGGMEEGMRLFHQSRDRAIGELST